MNLIGMHVYLTPDLVAEADRVAAIRQQQARKRNARHVNNFTGDAMAIDIIGARGERAAQEAFPLEWNSVDESRLDDADLGDFIDVKTTAYRTPWMKVPRVKLRPLWAYVLISAADHPHYRIVGWASGHEIKKAAPIECPQPNRPAYIVREGDAILHDARELQAIVKGMNRAL
jgi:hypothetical protein